MVGLMVPHTVDIFTRFYIGLSFISVWTERNLFIYCQRGDMLVQEVNIGNMNLRCVSIHTHIWILVSAVALIGQFYL